MTRLSRLRLGQIGDSRSVDGGVLELRLDFGPGYRIYYCILGQTTVLLLTGGNKQTQQKDISQAKKHWEEFKESHGN